MKSLNDVVIREGTITDAEMMWKIQKELVKEEVFLLTDPTEFNKMGDDQKQWIERILQNSRENFFIAEIDDQMVGWIVFQSPNRIRLNHTGTFGMAVLKGYRNRQIGRKLLEALLKWTENH